MSDHDEFDNKKRSRSPDFNDHEDEFDLLPASNSSTNDSHNYSQNNGGSSDKSPDKQKRARMDNNSSNNSSEGHPISTYDGQSMDAEQSRTNHRNQQQQQQQQDHGKVVMMRTLLTRKEAGIIIGRNGANVHTIRSKTDARVNLTDNFVGCTERVATVVGPLENVAQAFELMALMLAGVEGNNVTQTVPSPVTMRLLIPNNYMGSIIGKSGSKIKEIQNISGIRLNAQEHPLPGSTERQVNAVGLPDGIKIAVTEIATIIMNHSDRHHNVILYRPQPGITASLGMLGAAGAQAAAVLANPAAAAAAAATTLGPYGYNPGAIMAAPGAAPLAARATGLATTMNPLASTATQAQQIFIPNDLVGAIIGKGGSKINEIRQLSGANIKINEPDGNLRERLVTVTGTVEANQMALYLLYSRLEIEKQRIYGAAGANPAAHISAGRF